MCNKGRRQSPINVEPDKLLFDPYLRPLHIDKHKVVSAIQNNELHMLSREHFCSIHIIHLFFDNHYRYRVHYKTPVNR